jgi:hypothetical protein
MIILAFLGEQWLNDIIMDIIKMIVLAALLFLPMRLFFWGVRLFELWKWGG